MGRNNYFQFKQFRILQERSAMKVGIDGVLLGAWANLEGAKNILDVGTGTGLLALMAAQKTDAFIDAVELEPEAAAEALQNFNDSPWASRIALSIGAIQDFVSENKYDHIISNPPFFENGSKSNNVKRTQARHSDSLTLKELLEKSDFLLADGGKISLILPSDKEQRLFEVAGTFQLFVSRLFRVAPDQTKKPHRILVELSKTFGQVVEREFYIRNNGSDAYSDQYRNLTKDFYLAF